MDIFISLLSLTALAFGTYELPKYLSKSKWYRFFTEVFLLIFNVVVILLHVSFVVLGTDLGIYKIIFIILPCVYLLYLIYCKFHFRSITLFSIYEGLNELDEGIMIAKGNHVIFQNEAIDKLIYDLFRARIRNDKVLFKRLLEIQDTSVKFKSLICVRCNNRIYAFSRENLGDSYIEINSTDVTEEVMLIDELKEVTNELNNTEDVLNDYLNNIEQLENEKQKNFMLNKIHNVLSYKISVLNKEVVSKSIYDKKIYEELNDLNADFFDSNKLIENSINELNGDLNPIGANVEVIGKCPFRLTTDELIFEIIREATTNAIYHVDACKVVVTFYEDKLEITNNGKQDSEFKKGRGLTILEKRCHEKGWSVYFKPEDNFKIIVKYGEEI